MKSTSVKTVVVTGASTGIGWSTCKILLAQGFRVFGSVRRVEDGARLQAEFGDGFTPLLFDITDKEAIARGAATVAEALGGETLFALVNNAGIAVAGLLIYMTPDEMDKQLAVNVQGTLMTTQAFLPLLGTDKTRKGGPGRIVMMSSIGGTVATPFVGAYNTSKFALEGMSEALRRELMLFGIDVIVIAPGTVKTPIWGKASPIGQRYGDTPYGPVAAKLVTMLRGNIDKGLEPEDIGRGVLKAITASKPKVRYVLTPDPLQHFIVNHFPKRMVDRMMAKTLDLTAK